MFNFSAMFIVSPMFGIGKKILALSPDTTLEAVAIRGCFPAQQVPKPVTEEL